MADPKTLATIEGLRSGRAYWMPSEVALYRKPIVRALSPVAFIPIAGYLFNLFLQVRGYQSMMASRWFLYGAAVVLIAGFALFASSLPKFRKASAAVLVIATIIGAVCLDRLAVPKTEARPVAAAQPQTTPAKPMLTPRKSVKHIPKRHVPKRQDGLTVGNESTVLGNVPPGTKVGDRSVVMGSTDTHGNATYNQPGAYGYDAHAGPDSIAVGAHAGANAPRTDSTEKRKPK